MTIRIQAIQSRYCARDGVLLAVVPIRETRARSGPEDKNIRSLSKQSICRLSMNSQKKGKILNLGRKTDGEIGN